MGTVPPVPGVATASEDVGNGAGLRDGVWVDDVDARGEPSGDGEVAAC
jgi:hypothetical protein